MKRRNRKKKRGLARRYGRSMSSGHFGSVAGTMSEIGIPVRVHGTLFIQPHADEAFIDTVAEVVEEVAPEVVRETIDDLGVSVAMRDVEMVP
jgi:hypothetical protein